MPSPMMEFTMLMLSLTVSSGPAQDSSQYSVVLEAIKRTVNSHWPRRDRMRNSAEITSPCSAQFVEKSADGSTSSTTSVYTLQNGQLITGLGDAGQKKGDTAVVCGGGNVFTLDAKGCTKWEDFFGDWKKEAGECGLKKDGDKEVFWYKGMGGSESTLIVDGDVIWSEQLRDAHATKHPDLAA